MMRDNTMHDIDNDKRQIFIHALSESEKRIVKNLGLLHSKEFDEFLEVQHGKYLAGLFKQEMKNVANEIKLERYDNEHAHSIAQLFEIEAKRHKLEELNSNLAKLNHIAHKAGMADVAIDIIHNVGNILNSARISANEVIDTLKHSHVHAFFKANELLRNHMDKLDEYVQNDPKGKQNIAYYLALEEVLRDEYEKVNNDVKRILNSIVSVGDVIATQRERFKTAVMMYEEIAVVDLLNNVLSANSKILKRNDVAIKKQFEQVQTVYAHRVKLTQVLFYLVMNAVDAMCDNSPQTRWIDLSVTEEDNFVRIRVTDNGNGIVTDDLKRVFAQGSPSVPNEHGLDLHHCANYIKEMGGAMWAESDGYKKGATFVVMLPRFQPTSSGVPDVRTTQ